MAYRAGVSCTESKASDLLCSQHARLYVGARPYVDLKLAQSVYFCREQDYWIICQHRQKFHNRFSLNSIPPDERRFD